MARSVWKGPFVEESLIKKVEKQTDIDVAEKQQFSLFLGLLANRGRTKQVESKAFPMGLGIFSTG